MVHIRKYMHRCRHCGLPPGRTPPPARPSITIIEPLQSTAVPGFDAFHAFDKLPMEIKIEILKLCLVREKPIVNPHKVYHFYHPANWIENLTLSLLRVSKHFNHLCLPIFYKADRFLFTKTLYLDDSRKRYMVPRCRMAVFRAATVHRYVWKQEAGVAVAVGEVKEVKWLVRKDTMQRSRGEKALAVKQDWVPDEDSRRQRVIYMKGGIGYIPFVA